jgi:NAD+ synthase
MESHFNVTTNKIDLTGAFETTKSLLDAKVADNPLAMANLRARLRMCTLYAYAGHNSYLVAGTGNKVEDFGVGFFTKWADGAVDFSPIGDLSKSQVWELAKFLGVSNEIVNAKPTDGLWSDNRGDEDAIGATYLELEWAMAEWESGRVNLVGRMNFGTAQYGKVQYTDREIEVLKIYNDWHQANQHKFNPIPVCQIPSVLL